MSVFLGFVSLVGGLVLAVDFVKMVLWDDD
jgi:hypothetical protein